MKPTFLLALACALLYSGPCAHADESLAKIDRMIDECPGPETYPQASIVEILRHTEITLDADGFTRSRSTSLLKILDERARDVYGDQSVRFDAEKDTVIIEVARTRLPDGSWIEPEEDAFTLTSAREVQWASAYSQLKQQNVSFPGLDVGAAMYFVYRVEPKPGVDPPEGRQAGGSALFGSYEPILDLRYTVDVAAPWTIQYEMQNQDLEPEVDRRADRVIYRWSVSNTEQIIIEPDMVSISYLVPRLSWTSFADWEELGLYVGERFWEQVEESEVAVEEYLQTTGFDFRGRPALMNTALWAMVNIRTVYLTPDRVGWEPFAADKIWENRYGHSLDKAVLCTALLGSFGLQAIPVLVPNYDQPFSELPVLEQFNHVILAVPLSEDTVWIDLSNEFYAPDDLPYRATYGKGCMLLAGAPLLLEVAPGSLERRLVRTECQVSLDATGTLSGSVAASPRMDYGARARRIFKDQKALEREIYFQRIASSFGQGTRVTDSGNSDPRNLVEDFEVSMDFVCEQYAVIQDDLMLLELPANPFSFALTGFYPSLPEVRYPVDLPSRGKTTTVFRITVPSEYTVAYLPPPLVVVNPYLHLELVPKLEDNVIEWTQVTEVRADHVPVADYATVRDAYQSLVLPKNRLAILESDQDE